MLYDPKWEVETKADPFKLESLIAWIEKQPAEATYCYENNGQCLLSQYFALGAGYQHVHMFSDCFVQGVQVGDMVGRDEALRFFSRNIVRFPYRFDDVAKGTPRTFGAALDRARKLRASAE